VPLAERRRSPIAGHGLFATEPIAAGTAVLDQDGIGDLNHSCDPNLGWVDEYSLATMVDVSAGQELVSDYAMSTADPGYLLRCHCPSYRCRQMVEGGDWRIPQLQARYQGWWVPYVQSLVDAVTAIPSATAGRPGAADRPPSSHRGP